ncbi:hypothetical protein PUR33_00110, partial [Streptomyces sp. BE282]|nr:hypothetical protein [Streptomyces sp. BE282]
LVTAESAGGGAVLVAPRSTRPVFTTLEPTTSGTATTIIVATEPTTGAATTVVVPTEPTTGVTATVVVTSEPTTGAASPVVIPTVPTARATATEDDTAPPEIYTFINSLSIHDALPIYDNRGGGSGGGFRRDDNRGGNTGGGFRRDDNRGGSTGGG